MTIDHPVRRWLARVCSAETMARVVDPTLADMRVEGDGSRWIGYAALARALLLHAVTATPLRARDILRDDRRAVPRAALTCGVTALLAAAPLVAPPLLAARRWASPELVILLLP